MTPSKFDLVRACLREGPSTSPEVAAELGISVRQASAFLSNLYRRHQAEKIGRVPGHARQAAYIYQLIERG
jgi:predicted ArsR family transcriptional regulator